VCTLRSAFPRGERRSRFSGVVPLLSLGLLLIPGCESSREPPPAPSGEKAKAAPEKRVPPISPEIAKAIREFNRGAALLEQYRYPEAAEAFEKVLAAAPDWTAARFNLGLAALNMQEKQGALKFLEKAKECFEAVLEKEPGNLHARFCLGLLFQHLGKSEKALECFKAVHEKDPGDPYAAYKYAEGLLGVKRHDEARSVLEKVVERDPGFISGIYRLAQLYLRAGKRDKAVPLFKRFRNLNKIELTAGPFLVQKQYGAAGKYYLALGPDSLPVKAPPPPGRRIILSPEIRKMSVRTEAWRGSAGPVGLPGVAAGDLDGDGDLDLVLTGTGKSGTTSVWLNDGKGSFSPGKVLGEKGISPCLADVDNDGDLDLWLGGEGRDLCFENDGKGVLKEVKGPGGEDDKGACVCARLFDVDSDGDVDFLSLRISEGPVPPDKTAKAGSSAVWRNNRDGTYALLTNELGVDFKGTVYSSFLYDDFDDDRDLDLLFFPPGEGNALLVVNHRAWNFEAKGPEETGIDIKGVVSATSGDPDKDGDRDLLVFTGERTFLFRNRGGLKFEEDSAFTASWGRMGGTGGQFADMDNDGDLDIVIADARRSDGSRGPVLLVNDGEKNRFVDAAAADPGILLGALKTEKGASCVVADFTGNGRCDIFLAPTDSEPFLVENVTPGGHWIELDLLGTRGKDQKTRSNNSAIGARVEIKTGSILQQFVVGIPSGPLAVPPTRIHLGLDGNPTVDWLRIIWPDGVLQAELELAGDRVAGISEIQRKTSSCPLLFAWNGSRFDFVADFGGVGGLGYFIEPEVYAPPDSTEYVRIPLLRPKGDEYVLQVLGQLEEVIYFDQASLIAVDHPEGTTVYPNEMMAVNLPPPEFRVFCHRGTIEPVKVLDHRGRDVTGRLRRIDRRYAGATEPDHRFLGLAKRHRIDLDFGDRLSGMDPRRPLVLFLYGWVEYGYSATNYAASQAGLRAEAPSIEVKRHGKWVTLFKEAGYPAGINHMMTLDVSGKILPTDRYLRITSTMEIYWDRVYLAQHIGDDALTVKEVEAATADLHFRGHPREYSPDGRQPNLYDYDNVDTAVPWKLMAGRYTRYGPVTELIKNADDCYVIMGHGEELTLKFPLAAFGKTPPGFTRTFILKTDSWCKDMDLYTAFPDTVAPLPFHGMSGYPYRADEEYPQDPKRRTYRTRFNTRVVETQ